jgi:hypothetical protein
LIVFRIGDKLMGFISGPTTFSRQKLATFSIVAASGSHAVEVDHRYTLLWVVKFRASVPQLDKCGLAQGTVTPFL